MLHARRFDSSYSCIRYKTDFPKRLPRTPVHPREEQGQKNKNTRYERRVADGASSAATACAAASGADAWRSGDRHARCNRRRDRRCARNRGNRSGRDSRRGRRFQRNGCDDVGRSFMLAADYDECKPVLQSARKIGNGDIRRCARKVQARNGSIDRVIRILRSQRDRRTIPGSRPLQGNALYSSCS